MEIIIENTSVSAADLTVEHVLHHFRKKPNLVLGMAADPALLPVYTGLVERVRKENLNFSQVRIFLMCEFVDLPPEHDQSRRFLLDKHFLQHINIPLNNIRQLNGMAQDFEAEWRQFEEDIRAAGGIDLQLLTVGREANVGGSEIGESLQSRTGIHTLSRVSIMQYAVAFGDRALVPKYMLSMGLATIMESRHCLLNVTGAEVAEVAAAFIEGPVTAMAPASVLQMHPDCVCILDRQAAVKLKNQEFYRWVYSRKPDWQRIGPPPRQP